MALGLTGYGGSGEIRTHGTLACSAVFKTAAFNHSATLPYNLVYGCLAAGAKVTQGWRTLFWGIFIYKMVCELKS